MTVKTLFFLLVNAINEYAEENLRRFFVYLHITKPNFSDIGRFIQSKTKCAVLLHKPTANTKEISVWSGNYKYRVILFTDTNWVTIFRFTNNENVDSELVKHDYAPKLYSYVLRYFKSFEFKEPSDLHKAFINDNFNFYDDNGARYAINSTTWK